MSYATKYRVEFDTIKGRAVKIDIEEDGFAGSITDLTAYGESPLEVSYPNAEFDKLAGIRESKVRFKVLSGDVSASDFLTTSDTQYKVKIYINGTLEWVGWLDNNYLSEPFLDTPVSIELSASDGISLLKTTDLGDFSDGQIWGFYQVKNFIAWALHKTRLTLDWWSFINMFPAGADQRDVDDDFDAFYYSVVQSHMFLTGPRTFDDCYTVLSKIMESYNCVLFQSRGAWFIVQVNDWIAGRLDCNRRDYAGLVQESVTDQGFGLTIGLDETVKLINADAQLSWEKLYKEAVHYYNFKKPPIYFRNWDLQDGVYKPLLSSGSRGVYELDYFNDVDSILVDGSSRYFAVEFDANGSELVRYLLFYTGTSAAAADENGAKTGQYLVNKFDRINFSFSRREKNAGLNSYAPACWIRIDVGGGNYYTLDSTGEWRYNQMFAIQFAYNNAQDRRFWVDHSIQSKSIPATGLITVQFSSYGHSRTSNNEVHFKDVSFDVITYQNEMITVDGFEYKSSQTGNIKRKYDNELFFAKSDNVGTCGAILKDDYTQLAEWKYYSAADGTAVNFSKYINRAAWRTLYRNFTRIEGKLMDLYSSGRLLSPLNTVEFTAIPDKEFLITTLQMDVRNESAEFTMVEIRDTSNTDDFTHLGTEDFKYKNVKQQDPDGKIEMPKVPINWKFGTIGVIMSLIRRGNIKRFNNYD